MKTRLILGTVALCGALAMTACSGTSAGTGNVPPANGTALGTGPYQQLDRLNRPAINEVFGTFAQHDANNRDMPSNDAANLSPEINAFMQHIAGRSVATANFVSTVLAPDVQIADLSGTSTSCIGTAPGTCNNYLGVETGGVTQAPAGLKPFGGRALTDDIVSISLGVIFGGTVHVLGAAPDDNAEQDGRADAAYPSGHRPNLTTDNVTWQTAPKHYTTTFPYLGAPQ